MEEHETQDHESREHDLQRPLTTIANFLNWAELELLNNKVCFGHGFDNAWDEALALAIFVKGASWDVDETFLDAQITKDEAQQLTELLAKRINQRVPVAYLVEESWYLGLPFYVNQEVLIPRSPMAELIDDHFSLWFPENEPRSILDLCCGSACIGICCALSFPKASVDSTDISANALKVAKRNCDDYDLLEQVELIQSDLFKQLSGKRYDLIIANPPYVDQEDMDSLPDEYKHEPRIALAAGDDGLDLVRTILAQSCSFLTPEGVLIVEVGNSQEALMEQYPQVPFVWLEFEHGGHGVFAITHSQLNPHKKLFQQ